MSNNKDWTKEQVTAIENFALKQEDGRITNDALSELRKVKGLESKTIPSLRSKVVNLGYYQKAAAKPAAGGKVSQRKIEYVRAAETLVGMRKGSLDTLEKASKLELEALCKALTELSDKANAEKGLKEPS